MLFIRRFIPAKLPASNISYVLIHRHLHQFPCLTLTFQRLPLYSWTHPLSRAYAPSKFPFVHINTLTPFARLTESLLAPHHNVTTPSSPPVHSSFYSNLRPHSHPHPHPYPHPNKHLHPRPRPRPHTYPYPYSHSYPLSHPQSSPSSSSLVILSHLPESTLHYIQLARLDKPTGYIYLFFPCLFSTLLAASMSTPITTPGTIMYTCLLFFAGSITMRGAGCTINDIWDRKFDALVARTKFRPLARGAITLKSAITFTGIQCLLGLGILLCFPFQCFYYAVPSLIFVVLYPLAKRVTYYPQFILGLTYSWGAIMGFPALNINLLADPSAALSAASLYASCVAWVISYDTVYAHMDLVDDVKANVKSIAVKHASQAKLILYVSSSIQVSLLVAVGRYANAESLYYMISCGGTALALLVQIISLRLNNVENCWFWFKKGCWLTGGITSLGLLANYLCVYLTT